VKKITLIFIFLIIIIVLIAALTNSFSITVNSKSPSSSTSLETKESDEGPVSVTVTPLSLENNSPTWNFEISLNTHSEELSVDLAAVSELVDDQEKISLPISWEGDGPEGHHRKGVLKFKPISPKPASVELKIKNIGGVLERSFIWSL